MKRFPYTLQEIYTYLDNDTEMEIRIKDITKRLFKQFIEHSEELYTYNIHVLEDLLSCYIVEMMKEEKDKTPDRITKYDIYMLSQQSPIISHAIKLFEQNDDMTWEDVLMTSLYYLNEAYTNTICRI